MHTTRLDDYGHFAQHNGDFSGDVKFSFQLDEMQTAVESDKHIGTFHINIPFEWLEELVGTKILNERVSKLEDMSPKEVLNA